MAAYSGKNGLIKAGATPVGESKGWTIDEEIEAHDATAQRDATRKDVAGFASFTGSFTVNDDPADLGQQALTLGAEIAFEFMSQGETTGRPKLSGTCLITKIGHVVPMEGINERSYDFKSNGGALVSGAVA
jgi:hypothetical protein